MAISRKAAALASIPAGLVLALATGAYAAPPTAAANDAKLQAMQRQIDELRSQLSAMRTPGEKDAKLEAMQKQLDDMAAQLAEMKTTQETAVADIETLKLPPAGATLVPSMSDGKPVFTSGDKRFSIALRSIIMLDAGKYFQDDNLPAATVGRDLNQGTNFRRARIGFSGKMFNDFDYVFIYEFGGSGGEDPGRLYEASLTYNVLMNNAFRIRLGAFEPNIGLAAAVSTSEMPLMERPSPAEVARNVAAGDSRVALQLMGTKVFGSGDAGFATRVSGFTAVTGNTVSTISSSGGATAQPFDEQTAWIGRFAVAPYYRTNWLAHIGVNYQYVIEPNDAGPATAPRYAAQLRDRPELRIDGTRLIDTGAIDAEHASVLGLEGGFLSGPFLIESEWFRYKIDRRFATAARPADPHFEGWYVQGAWTLTSNRKQFRSYDTGEARFKGPKPDKNFNPATGDLGLFEVAARYSVTDLDYQPGSPGTPAQLSAVRGGEQKIINLGLNWYLTPTLRMMFDYLHVDVDRLNAAGAQIGQEYDAVAARAQVSF